MAKAYWNENGRWLCGGPEDFFGTADGMPPGEDDIFCRRRRKDEHDVLSGGGVQPQRTENCSDDDY